MKLLRLVFIGFISLLSLFVYGQDPMKCEELLLSGPFEMTVSAKYFRVPRIVFVTGKASSGKTYVMVEGLLPYLKLQGQTGSIVSFSNEENKNLNTDDNVLVLDDVPLMEIKKITDLVIERFFSGSHTIIIIKAKDHSNIGDLPNILGEVSTKLTRAHSSKDQSLPVHKPILHIGF